MATRHFVALAWLTAVSLAVTLGTARSEETSPDAKTPAEIPAEVPSVDTGRAPQPLRNATAARLLEQVSPPYPRDALQRRQEGWVDLSFVIRPDGTVADPVIEDSSGIADFERAALRAVAVSRYSPATIDEQPVEQCSAQMRYTFQIANRQRGADEGFRSRYRKATEALVAGDVAQAQAIADEMDGRLTRSLYESAYLWVLRAELLDRAGDKPAALAALVRAADAKGKHLEPGLYGQVLKNIFWRAVALQQWSRALQAEQDLLALAAKIAGKGKKKSQGTTAVDPRLLQAAVEIRSAIAGDQVLGFPGTIGYRSGCAEGRANWQHEPVRREFGFAEVEGQVDEFELRCDWRRIRGAVTTEQAWQVPDNWGWCQLFVFGEVGSRVRLVEYPLEPETPKDARPTR